MVESNTFVVVSSSNINNDNNNNNNNNKGNLKLLIRQKYVIMHIESQSTPFFQKNVQDIGIYLVDVAVL